MNVLRIIQGDSINAELELTGLDAPNVERLYIESPVFPHDYYLGQTTEPLVWALLIPSEDTSAMRVGTFQYNIVAETTGGRKVTILYNEKLKVLFKEDAWIEAS